MTSIERKEFGIGRSRDRDADGLTPAQRRFLEAYAGDADFDAVKALELAGYKTEGRSRSANSQTAIRILQTPEARKYLAELAEVDPLAMGRQERLRLLTRIGRGELTESRVVNGELMDVPATIDQRLKALSELGKAAGEGVKIEVTVRPEQMSDAELAAALELMGHVAAAALPVIDTEGESDD